MQTFVDHKHESYNSATQSTVGVVKDRAEKQVATGIRRVRQWLSRLEASRRAQRELSRMTDYELRDIGLNRFDIVNVTGSRDE